MKELSIFIDESGDFGVYSPHSPFYIIAMVFHDQGDDIQPAIINLNRELSYLGLDNLCIHTGPIIRKEEIYADMEISERRRIFNKMIAFIRQINIRYKSFYVKKRPISDSEEIAQSLLYQITEFVRTHFDELISYNPVKIYYDNGQIELSKILHSAFHSLLPNPVFRKVMPKEYKLFQVADLICTLELVKLKLDINCFTKTEMVFFGHIKDLKKNYLKPLSKKEWL